MQPHANSYVDIPKLWHAPVVMMSAPLPHFGSHITQQVRTAARHATGISRCCALIVACAVAIAPAGIAQAQVVERNLPPEPPRRASAIKIGTDDLLKSDDATPLGVNVHAIVLIGANAGAKPQRPVKRAQRCLSYPVRWQYGHSLEFNFGHRILGAGYAGWRVDWHVR